MNVKSDYEDKKKRRKVLGHKLEKAKMPKGSNNWAYDDDNFENNFKDIELSAKKTSENVDLPTKNMDFDDILPLIGEFGRYQKILFLFMIPFEFFLVFVYFTQIFMTLTPENYWCNVPELANLTQEER